MCFLSLKLNCPFGCRILLRFRLSSCLPSSFPGPCLDGGIPTISSSEHGCVWGDKSHQYLMFSKQKNLCMVFPLSFRMAGLGGLAEEGREISSLNDVDKVVLREDGHLSSCKMSPSIKAILSLYVLLFPVKPRNAFQCVVGEI